MFRKDSAAGLRHHHAGVNEQDALMTFDLAPVSSRRDIAMLGIIHRASLGKEPSHFMKVLGIDKRRRVGELLKDPRDEIKSPLIRRSILGLVAVYNKLPHVIKMESTVSKFQKALQTLLKRRCEAHCEDWQDTFSPRTSLQRHPLNTC